MYSKYNYNNRKRQRVPCKIYSLDQKSYCQDNKGHNLNNITMHTKLDIFLEMNGPQRITNVYYEDDSCTINVNNRNIMSSSRIKKQICKQMKQITNNK